MSELDQSFDPPTREQLAGDVAGVDVDREYVVFRAVCGARGYFCSATFRDPVGYGGGKTPREALRSLASNLRTLADKVDFTACDLREQKTAVVPLAYNSTVRSAPRRASTKRAAQKTTRRSHTK